MKFGSHSYIFTDRWSNDSLHILDTARRLCLDCVEIGIGDDVSFSPALTRRRAEQLGLDLAVSPGGRWPLDCDLSSERAGDRKKGLAWHKRQADLAGEMGAIAYCGSIYGHTGVVRPRAPTRDEYLHMAEGLHELAEHAKTRGVAIVLEPMSHFRTHLINKPPQLMRLIRLADHGNLRGLFDTYHMITEVRDYAEAVRTLRGCLWGVHACESDRGVPGGGLVPWPDFFHALAGIRFDGYVIMESYNSSLPAFAGQHSMFHNVCPDATAFIRRGLRFLKAGIKKAGFAGARGGNRR